MEQILEFFYTGTIQIDSSNVCSLLTAANLMQLEGNLICSCIYCKNNFAIGLHLLNFDQIDCPVASDQLQYVFRT